MDAAGQQLLRPPFTAEDTEAERNRQGRGWDLGGSETKAGELNHGSNGPCWWGRREGTEAAASQTH